MSLLLQIFLPGPSPLGLPCYFCWIPRCLRAAVAPVSHPFEGKNWTSHFLRSLVTRRGRVGLDHTKCASTACPKSTFLAGNKSCSGSHKFFMLAAGDFCVLLITKIWLMPSCSCCRALLKEDDRFSLTSLVPMGFVYSVWALLCLSCSVSLQSLKMPNDFCFPTPKLDKIVELFFLWHVYNFVQKLACFHWQWDLSFSQGS